MKQYTEKDREAIRLAVAFSTLAHGGGEGLQEFWDSLADQERTDVVSGLMAIQTVLLMRLAHATAIDPMRHLQAVALLAETEPINDV